MLQKGQGIDIVQEVGGIKSVDEAMPLEDAKNTLAKKLVVCADTETENEETVLKLKQMFLECEGNTPVVFSVKENDSVRNFYTDYKITINDDLIKNVRKLIGDNAVLFSTI